MRQLSIRPQLVERVYDAILDAICNGELESGTRLAQERLATELRVSRQPVLQALALLKSQGFLCEAGRRGLMVAPLDGGYVRMLYEFRGALDRLAARTAAANWDGTAAAGGRRVLAKGRRALASCSVGELIAADVEFHRFVYQLSGNPIIAGTMGLHWNHMRRVMSAYRKRPDWADDTWREHVEILDLIRAGDGEAAARLAAAHVDKASRLLEAELPTGLGATGGAQTGYRRRRG